jgi:hypothetical protein
MRWLAQAGLDDQFQDVSSFLMVWTSAEACRPRGVATALCMTAQLGWRRAAHI